MKQNQRIGIFDSGLGGLLILKNILKRLPRYNFLYLGDTKRVPYGNRSQKTIYQFTKNAVDYLFSQNCQLIILACNTASSQALRKIQQKYLPKKYPARRVLGVIIPTVEAALELKNIKKVGVLATPSTVASGTFIREFKKASAGWRKKIKVIQQAAPLLVPLIENNGLKWAEPIIKEYLKPLLTKKVNAIILGCTHYPALKNKIRQIAGRNIKIISQDEIIPDKLHDYLKRHPGIENKLQKNGKRIFLVTDITKDFQMTAKKWLGKDINLRLINLD
jgi:glutamate racemase